MAKRNDKKLIIYQELFSSGVQFNVNKKLLLPQAGQAQLRFSIGPSQSEKN
jgi:hypothetical protein